MKYLEPYKRRYEILDNIQKNFNASNIDSDMFREIPRRVYRYSSLTDYAIKDIFENQITLINPYKFNDVHDSFYQVFSEEKEILEYNYLYNSSKNFGSDFPLSLDQYLNLAKESSKAYHPFARKNLLIKSFTSSSKNLVLWGNYANENKGICIEYDTEHESFNYLYPVVYNNKILSHNILDEQLTEENITLTLIMSAIHKKEDWNYEKEWRIIYPNLYSIYYNDFSEQYMPIKIGKPTKVILGYNFFGKHIENNMEEQAKIIKLIKILDAKNIPTKSIILNHGELEEKKLDIKALLNTFDRYKKNKITYEDLQIFVYNEDKLFY